MHFSSPPCVLHPSCILEYITFKTLTPNECNAHSYTTETARRKERKFLKYVISVVLFWRRPCYFILFYNAESTTGVSIVGRTIAVDFPPRRPGFDPRSSYVGFVVDKMILGQVSSQYFGFPCQFSFHQIHHAHPSFGAGTVVADVPSVPSLTPLQETRLRRVRNDRMSVIVRLEGVWEQAVVSCSHLISWDLVGKT
jgi:hypothetical protein